MNLRKKVKSFDVKKMDETIMESFYNLINKILFLYLVLYPGSYQNQEIHYHNIFLKFLDRNFQRNFKNYEKKYTNFRKKIHLLILTLGISDIITNSIYLIDNDISKSNIVFGIVLFLFFFFEIVCIFEMKHHSRLADLLVKLFFN